MTTTPEQRIAGRIREARRLAGLSQEKAGAKVGVTLRTWARWERCESLGFIGQMSRIAHALGVDADDLLAGEVLSGSHGAEDLGAKLDELLAQMDDLRHLLGAD